MRWSTRWASLREAAARVSPAQTNVPASIASDVLSLLSRALPSHSRGDQGGKPPTGGSSSSTSTAATTAFETRFSSAPSSTISFVRIAQHKSRSGSAHATVPVAPTCPCEAAPSQADPQASNRHRRRRVGGSRRYACCRAARRSSRRGCPSAPSPDPTALPAPRRRCGSWSSPPRRRGSTQSARGLTPPGSALAEGGPEWIGSG